MDLQSGPVDFLATEETQLLQRGAMGHADLTRTAQRVTMAWHAVPVLNDGPAPIALCGFKWSQQPTQPWHPNSLTRCPDCSRRIAELKAMG